MEKLRADRLNECAIMVQKHMRGFHARIQYIRVKKLANMMQCVVRRKLAQRQLDTLKKEKAAIVIQSTFRRHLERKKYVQKMAAVIKIQAGK
jgi:myosin-5